jgi:hypothetical protein
VSLLLAGLPGDRPADPPPLSQCPCSVAKSPPSCVIPPSPVHHMRAAAALSIPFTTLFDLSNPPLCVAAREINTSVDVLLPLSRAVSGCLSRAA